MTCRRHIVPTALLLLSAAPGVAAPPDWFSGDLHAHDASGCEGPTGPEEFLERMPALDLDLVSVLLYCNGRLESDREELFLGREDAPGSTPDRIVHYDFELSRCGLADRLGHGLYQGLSNLDFPPATVHAPIAEWTRAQGGYVGMAHTQRFPGQFGDFPALGYPDRAHAAPIEVALGRVDYLDFQPIEPGWRFMWYTLLDLGFRPGLAITSDATCLPPLTLGSVRTWARLDGPLSYERFLSAVAAGRTVVVEQGGPFLDLRVEAGGRVARPGDELSIERSASPVSVEVRVLPGGPAGVVELVRNQVPIARQSYQPSDQPIIVRVTDFPERSAWYAARTSLAHTGAVFAIVEDAPIRASVEAADYYLAYIDVMEARVLGPYVWPQILISDRVALLDDFERAREIFGRIRAETVPEPGRSARAAALCTLALLALRPARTSRRPAGGSGATLSR